VLVQAGAGAVGLAAIQLAKKAGAAVLASASSDARLERLKAFGMDHGINYSRDDLVEADEIAVDTASTDAAYPTRLTLGDQTLSVGYRFDPGTADDGVTVTVPLPLLITDCP